MTTSDRTGWPFFEDIELSLSVDVREMGLDAAGLERSDTLCQRAIEAMRSLEAGATANPSEGRRVGHYWLRAPELAPDASITEAIRDASGRVRDVAERLASFAHVVHIGIGGSALGPQLLVGALADQTGRDRLRFLDNIDPDGIADTLQPLDLARTAVVVVSKSGGTAETMGTLDRVVDALDAAGVSLAERAVAITASGSALDTRAQQEGWLATLPMWDWVGGRTSVTSVVGLAPAALSGVDGAALLAGAARMDAWTRAPSAAENPALAMALAWHEATEGRAARANVVLPYADRLRLLTPYLQQLIMESLGKRHGDDGAVVHQGLTVYGHKGATDQHAYVQQLREGPDDHFVTFVEVRGRVTGGQDAASDTLSALLAGTRAALGESGRRTMTIGLGRLDARSLGALIALFERAVGFYATFVGINAYDQPGVEAGKRCAARVLTLQETLQGHLASGRTGDASSFAEALGEEPALVLHVLRHLVATGRARALGAGLTQRFCAID